MDPAAPEQPMNTLPPDHRVTVLLVDDQAIVAAKVRSQLAGETDIQFHYCQDPTQAIARANEVGPTVILQDLVMPEIDGLTLVKYFRANASTREVPLIVLSTKEEAETKAQAFAVGANDYLVKLPDKLELLARIRYHSKGYIAQLERNEAYRKLAESQRLLAEEVAQAAKYVRSLLPAPVPAGPVRVDWRFIPSTQLGGDSFGYHWLDDEHFALYLLDVSGHGVGASLLSVSVMNVLGARSLPGTDFRDPGQVLSALNSAFPMEKHDNKYFTIWYGVYRKNERRLAYAGGGHPSMLLFTGADAAGAAVRQLASQGPAVGIADGLPFDTDVTELGPYARLFLFSDGVFEIEQTDGRMWNFEDFARWLPGVATGSGAMDQLLEHVRRLHAAETLGDDFSMMQAEF
jgi:sigma-B regulation protein RsbU (phosphoserine phosphatase)